MRSDLPGKEEARLAAADDDVDWLVVRLNYLAMSVGGPSSMRRLARACRLLALRARGGSGGEGGGIRCCTLGTTMDNLH